MSSGRRVDGILLGLGGGESGRPCSSSATVKCRRSAQGLKEGSLVTRLMLLLLLPTDNVLGDKDILLQEFLQKKFVKKLPFSP